MRRLRSLTEAECYARCYGRFEDTVRVIRLDPKRPRRIAAARVSGEDLRRSFEERLGSRDAEAA